MKRFLLAALAVLLLTSTASAQQGPSQITGCAYLSSPTTLADKQTAMLNCSQTQRLKVETSQASGVSDAVVGNVASGATDSGNPVKIGCKFNTTLPTPADTQRVDCQSDTNGALVVSLVPGTKGVGSNALNTDGLSSSVNGLRVSAAPFLATSSTTSDRGFACVNNAQATVTAGNTTQLVALASSQIIRVCSMHIGIATTGTYSVVYGTGANCATGTTTLIPATNLTAGNVAVYGDGNAAVVRTIASNALCVAAVTGNVQVQLTYAQY